MCIIYVCFHELSSNFVFQCDTGFSNTFAAITSYELCVYPRTYSTGLCPPYNIVSYLFDEIHTNTHLIVLCWMEHPSVSRQRSCCTFSLCPAQNVPAFTRSIKYKHKHCHPFQGHMDGLLSMAPDAYIVMCLINAFYYLYVCHVKSIEMNVCFTQITNAIAPTIENQFRWGKAHQWKKAKANEPMQRRNRPTPTKRPTVMAKLENGY